MHGERGWKESLVKIAKNYHNWIASLYVSMTNLIIITISSKLEILLKNCKIGRYLNKKEDRKVDAGVSLGGVEEMEHICELTNLIVNRQLLKLFINPILTNVLIWMIVLPALLNSAIISI